MRTRTHIHISYNNEQTSATHANMSYTCDCCTNTHNTAAYLQCVAKHRTRPQRNPASVDGPRHSLNHVRAGLKNVWPHVVQQVHQRLLTSQALHVGDRVSCRREHKARLYLCPEPTLIPASSNRAHLFVDPVHRLYAVCKCANTVLANSKHIYYHQKSRKAKSSMRNFF